MQRVAIAVLMMEVMTACGDGGGTHGPVALPVPALSTITDTSERKTSSAAITVIPIPVASVSVMGVTALTPGAVSGFTALLRDAAGATPTKRSPHYAEEFPNIQAS